MKEKKHIDQLFKDSLKNFEASPSPQVWNNIQAELNKEKKDRKVIPLWFKLGGIAALLALLFTIGNSVFNNTNNPISPSITEENKQQNNINKTNIDPLVITNKEESIIASDNQNTNSSEEKNTTNKTKINTPTLKEKIINSSTSQKIRVANNTTPTTIPKDNTNSYLIKENTIINQSQEVIASQSNNNKKMQQKNNNSSIENNEYVILKNIPINDKPEENSEKTNTDIAKNNTVTQQELKDDLENKKPSILDIIEEQKNAEEAVATTKNKLDNRWEVAPNFAPVFYNTLSDGSSIDPSFADNSKSSDVNFSYGLQVSYALSERFSVRTGVNTVNLSYGTNDVELGTGPVSAALQSINYGNQELVLTAFDKGTLTSQNTQNEGEYGDVTPKATNGDASIQQKINYYEVPLELKYALLNRKFGINLIGGVSTLFLGDNEISVEAGDFKSTLGEANNLSSVSFTTNIGLGVHYKFSRKFRFNIEPMFKYQLNPYTDSSVDYKPYYIGVYTGLSFKF